MNRAENAEILKQAREVRNDRTGKFHRKHHAFQVAYMNSATVSEAARKAGVSIPSAYRWAKEPEFRAEIEEARREGVSAVMTRLVTAGHKAIDALVKVMESGDPRARVDAAEKILTTLARMLTSANVTVAVNQNAQTVNVASDAAEIRERLVASIRQAEEGQKYPPVIEATSAPTEEDFQREEYA